MDDLSSDCDTTNKAFELQQQATRMKMKMEWKSKSIKNLVQFQKVELHVVQK